MRLVETYDAESSQNGSIFGIPQEMHGVFLPFLKYTAIARSIFVQFQYQVIFRCKPEINSALQRNPRSYEKPPTPLPPQNTMFLKTTKLCSETMYVQCCVLLDLFVYIVVEELSTSYFLYLKALFELIYCTLSQLFTSCEGVARWCYGASTSVENTNIPANQVKPTLVNRMFQNMMPLSQT